VEEREAGVAVPGEGRAGVRGTLGGQLEAVRRYWWVGLAVVWLALIGSVISTARTPTTYVGRTSLIVSSNDRSPDQDAVLVQGYVTYFDNSSYQQQLLSKAKVEPGATVAAQAAAASPILVVTVTSTRLERAQADAIQVARVFQDDINQVHARTTAAELATLQDQLDSAMAGGSKASQAVIVGLQDRIRQLQDDQVNVLQELQSNGGVSVQSPSWMSNLLLALLGGLFAGVLAALTLAKFSPRLRSAQEVADKVGLNTLVELPAARARDAVSLREQRLRKLANVVRARLGEAGVVSVTQPRDGAASWVVARELALELATQGHRTVLVRLGGGSDSSGWRIGGKPAEHAEPAEARAALSRLRVGPVGGLSVLDLRPRSVGAATNLPAAEIAKLLRLEPLAGSFVILETPAVVDSAPAQAASIAADAAVLVLDPQQARVGEAREAMDVLRQSGAVLLGAVLAPVSEDHSPRSLLQDGHASRSDEATLDRGWSTGTAGWSWWPTSTGVADASNGSENEAASVLEGEDGRSSEGVRTP